MKKFNSLLGPDMESFLELKESLGYSRNTYQYQLGKIDEYAITNHPQLDVMNEAMVWDGLQNAKGRAITAGEPVYLLSVNLVNTKGVSVSIPMYSRQITLTNP